MSNLTDSTTENITTTDLTTLTSTALVSTTGTSSFIGCESLIGKGLSLSSTNNSQGAVVNVDCDEFGHRPSGGITQLQCLPTNSWNHPIPSCEWSWELSTQEKIIFGTAVAAASFIIVVVIAIIVAYCCCYKKRKEEDEKIYESSYHGSNPRTGIEGPYQERELYPVTYLAYQDVSNVNDKFDGYNFTGTLDKPWLGYIPRPKVTESRFSN